MPGWHCRPRSSSARSNRAECFRLEDHTFLDQTRTPAVVSAHDGSVLELPLKVVAPPFLARQREAAKLQKKVSVDDDIPNLFFGCPRPEAQGDAVVASGPPTPRRLGRPTQTSTFGMTLPTRLGSRKTKPSAAPRPGPSSSPSTPRPTRSFPRAAALLSLPVAAELKEVLSPSSGPRRLSSRARRGRC